MRRVLSIVAARTGTLAVLQFGYRWLGGFLIVLTASRGTGIGFW
jgi:hypothetical protein